MPRLPLPLLWALLIAFCAYSLWVLMQVGYVGIWLGGLANPGSTQITIDLVIACGLLLACIVRECRAAGRNAWPWVAAVLGGGSIGVLLYLLWRDTRRTTG